MKKFNLKLLLALFIAMSFFGSCGSSNPISALSPTSSFMSGLASNPNLSTIAGLLKSPEIGKLMGDLLKKPFTLLAPTNDAFTALGADAVTNLAKPENVGQLTSLLKNHLLSGKMDAAAIQKGGLSSASGNPLNVTGANLGSLISSDQGNIIPIDKVLQ